MVATHTVEMQMIVVMPFMAAIVAQGIVSFPVFSRNFVNLAVFAKSMQDAVNGYAV